MLTKTNLKNISSFLCLNELINTYRDKENMIRKHLDCLCWWNIIKIEDKGKNKYWIVIK
jgi:hypothetical protein